MVYKNVFVSPFYQNIYPFFVYDIWRDYFSLRQKLLDLIIIILVKLLDLIWSIRKNKTFHSLPKKTFFYDE